MKYLLNRLYFENVFIAFSLIILLWILALYIKSSYFINFYTLLILLIIISVIISLITFKICMDILNMLNISTVINGEKTSISKKSDWIDWWLLEDILLGGGGILGLILVILPVINTIEIKKSRELWDWWGLIFLLFNILLFGIFEVKLYQWLIKKMESSKKIKSSLEQGVILYVSGSILFLILLLPYILLYFLVIRFIEY